MTCGERRLSEDSDLRLGCGGKKSRIPCFHVRRWKQEKPVLFYLFIYKAAYGFQTRRKVCKACEGQKRESSARV